ncbi:hypothetical protein TIFTF001_005746 [Ficus carica]|uniref:Uncharacterized protein n=1 Tax=Ficus carica TaxID=3494 RepID=A0AA87ZKG1_FICCA|nr:hypothetical protein TIFTF001_005746 [Ficus carica]
MSSALSFFFSHRDIDGVAFSIDSDGQRLLTAIIKHSRSAFWTRPTKTQAHKIPTRSQQNQQSPTLSGRFSAVEEAPISVVLRFSSLRHGAVKKTAEGDEDLPRNAKICEVTIEIKWGVEDYEPRVIQQFV